MECQEPEIEVLHAASNGATSIVVLRFLDWDAYARRANKALYPVAPAGLYRVPELGVTLFELHRLMTRRNSILEFETYDTVHSLPKIGDQLRFRSWWTHDAMEMVLDKAAEWTEQSFPQEPDHEHCPLSWKVIKPGDVAYYSQSNGWIAASAYHHYIEHDRLRIRLSKARVEDC